LVSSPTEKPDFAPKSAHHIQLLKGLWSRKWWS